jgi:hypothetical protein
MILEKKMEIYYDHNSQMESCFMRPFTPNVYFMGDFIL